MKTFPLLPLLLATVATFGSAEARSAPDDGGWNLRLTPYLWAPSVSGSVNIDNVGGGGGGIIGGDAEDEGGSALDYLSGAAMLTFEAQHDDWAVLADFVWAEFELEGTLDGPLATEYDAESDEIIFGIAGARVITRGERGRLEGVFGLRYFHVDLGIDPEGGTPLSASQEADMIDPFLGLRGRLGEQTGLFGMGYADVGGFGISSDLTWQVLAGAGWAWSWGDVRLGWRQIAYDFDSSGVLYDLSAGGVFLGLSFAL